MSVLERLGGSVKTLMDGVKALPFSSYGGNGWGGSGYMQPVSLYGNGFIGSGLPGTTYDYRAAAGVLWQNPSAAACFGALSTAFAQASPILEKREGAEWNRVDEHPLIDLLNVPNEGYSGTGMFGVTLISTLANGSGFWRIERDRKGDPAELWYEPPAGVGPTGIAPTWNKEHYIKDYAYFVDGKRVDNIPREDVVYFRHGLNPANSREPWAPLGLGAREIASLNSASTYTGSLLRNSAVPSGMISLEGSGLASGTPPTPEQAEEMKRRVTAGFTGDNVGKPFISSLPWKWTPFNWSPSQMSIDKIQQWPQGIVCALLRTPEIVALLPAGEQPTYENLGASMEWWWNNTIIPLEDAFGNEIETQLFPSYSLDRRDYRLNWDRSRVPALQEDEQAKHEMVREDFKAGIIDLEIAVASLGHKPTPDMKGKYFVIAKDVNAEPEPEEEPAGNQQAVKLYDGNGMSHGNDGRFDGGSGGAFNSLHKWEGPPAPHESEELQEGKAKAFAKLLPYAIDGKKEAASVILNRDGKEIVFKVGEIDEVSFNTPLFSKCTVLHTHPDDISFSGKDWYSTLSSDSVMQEHVVGPSTTFSLHKPEGWKGLDIDYEHFNAEREEILLGIELRALDEGKTLSDAESNHQYNQTMADKYGILYRVGTHKKEVD